jgi:hypothetical protein
VASNRQTSKAVRWLGALSLGASLAAGGSANGQTVKPTQTGGPIKVEIRKADGQYQLYVGGRPFYIQGAGIEHGSQEKLKAHGGNSLRTWGTGNARQILDRSLENGLYVTLGLDVARERHGFDYDDQAAVARQLARLKAEVLNYKDHPALIIWAIGNELNLGATNPRVWEAVNQISKMIHEVDANHLTTTTLAGLSPAVVRDIKTRAPDLDLLSIQMYGDLSNLPQRLHEATWEGPYLVTEWGTSGHWEVAKTSWGAPLECDSSTKADFYLKRFQTAIRADRAHCLGSYAFLWGQKQERTPTWFGMFLASGEETAAVDAMHYLWTGAWPANRSPQIEGAWLAGKTASENIRLKPGQSYPARVQVTDPDQDPLTYSWEVMEESSELKTGGDTESKPKSLPGVVAEARASKVVVKAPTTPGAYRLFVYAFDGHGHAAHVNIPFFVEQPTDSSLKTASQ